MDGRLVGYRGIETEQISGRVERGNTERGFGGGGGRGRQRFGGREA